MHGSEPKDAAVGKTDRRPLRDFGAMKRSDRICALIGAGLSALLLVIFLWLAQIVFQDQYRQLIAASQDAARTLAEAVAEDFSTAVGYGIPLPQMRGADEYLAGVLRAEALVSSIAVIGSNEEFLFSTPNHDNSSPPLRAPIYDAEQPVGTVLVVPSPNLPTIAKDGLSAAAIATALMIACLLAVVLRLVALERINLPRMRLGASAAAVARGVFSDFSPTAEGPLHALGRQGAGVLGTTRKRHRSLNDMTDEVRALDTDGALGPEIDAALKPLRQFVFDRPRAAIQFSVAPLWWPLLGLTLLIASHPLVASFAADRIGSGELANLTVAATLMIYAVGLLAGLGLSAHGPLRGSKWVSVLAMILAGGAIASTYWIGDPVEFGVAQGAAGLFGGWAVGAFFMIDGALRRAPWQGGLVLIAAFAIGLPFGSLLAEAVGRRAAFLTIGVMCALAGLLMIAGPTHRPKRSRVVRHAGASNLLALTTASTAFFVLCDLSLSLGVMRENYAGLAAALSLFATCALLPMALVPRPLAWFSAAGSCLAVIALLSLCLGAPAVLAASVLGAGTGLIVSQAGSVIFARPAVLCMVAGPVLAAISEALGALLGGVGLSVGTGVCAITCALAVFAARQSGR